MRDASSTKRKRDGESAGKARKRVTLDVPVTTVSVKSVLRPLSCPPVIGNLRPWLRNVGGLNAKLGTPATAPGIEVSPNLTYHSYVRHSESQSKSNKDATSQEMQLRSTGHPSIDYTAQEEEPAEKRRLNHYLGIYDAKTGKLEVIEAKKMIVRGEVRARRAPTTTADQGQSTKSAMDARTELAELFGNKKAKKMVSERKMNAFTSGTISGGSGPREQADATMLSSIGAVASQMATQEELQALVTEAKPIPLANLEASSVEQVYVPADIIGREILDQVPVREWQEKTARDEGIKTNSRFVAVRVNALASDASAIDRLRVLRYLEFMIKVLRCTSGGQQRGLNKMPPAEKLSQLLSPAPEPVIRSILLNFSDQGVMRKFHADKLKAYCAAFACIVDNFEVDIRDLQEDLLLQSRPMKQYFCEIGAKVKQVAGSTPGQKINLAKLALPLQFPKQRRMARRK